MANLKQFLAFQNWNSVEDMKTNIEKIWYLDKHLWRAWGFTYDILYYFAVSWLGVTGEGGGDTMGISNQYRKTSTGFLLGKMTLVVNKYTFFSMPEKLG